MVWPGRQNMLIRMEVEGNRIVTLPHLGQCDICMAWTTRRNNCYCTLRGLGSMVIAFLFVALLPLFPVARTCTVLSAIR